MHQLNQVWSYLQRGFSRGVAVLASGTILFSIVFTGQPSLGQAAQKIDHLNLGCKYYWKHQYFPALRECLIADTEMPGDYYTSYMIGACFACLGDGKSAINYFHRCALYSDPGSRDQGFALDAPYQFGLMASKPKHGNIAIFGHQDAAHMYEASHNFASALQEYLADFEHNKSDAIIAYQIGSCYAKLGEPKKAIEYINKAAVLEGPDNTLFKSLAATANEDFGAGKPLLKPDPYRHTITFGARFLPGPPEEHPPL